MTVPPALRPIPVLLAVLLSPPLVHAMKPAIPDNSHHASADGVVTLDIPDKTTGKVPVLRVKAKGKAAESLRWPAPMLPPSVVVISPSTRTVALLGGLGDSGSTLGRVELRSFEGDVKATLNLKDHIPDLENQARGFREKAGNFPWIETAAEDGSVLSILVVGRIPVRVDLRTHAVTVGPQAP
jgi:hypothetical protein